MRPPKPKSELKAGEPDLDPSRPSFPRKPVFPPITQEFVEYLKAVDASPALIAQAQKSADKAKAEHQAEVDAENRANEEPKTSWWDRLRGR